MKKNIKMKISELKNSLYHMNYKENKKLYILFFVTILLFISYYFIITNVVCRHNFEKENIYISEKNENVIFKIDKIISYSSAYAIDNSEQKTLEDLAIQQFSDIAIYINNSNSIKELTNENTIKEIYIDNIQINEHNKSGTRIVNYKNALDFGKFKELNFINSDNNSEDTNTTDNKIYFDIIKTNENNSIDNYDSPVFFTDCSNPLTIGYINKDIIKGFVLPEHNKSISLNGTMLNLADIPLKDIQYDISFTINIKNNLDQNFSCNIHINNLIGSNEIYNGYIARQHSNSEIAYNFFNLCY